MRTSPSRATPVLFNLGERHRRGSLPTARRSTTASLGSFCLGSDRRRTSPQLRHDGLSFPCDRQHPVAGLHLAQMLECQIILTPSQTAVFCPARSS